MDTFEGSYHEIMPLLFQAEKTRQRILQKNLQESAKQANARLLVKAKELKQKEQQQDPDYNPALKLSDDDDSQDSEDSQDSQIIHSKKVRTI